MVASNRKPESKTKKVGASDMHDNFLLLPMLDRDLLFVVIGETSRFWSKQMLGIQVWLRSQIRPTVLREIGKEKKSARKW